MPVISAIGITVVLSRNHRDEQFFEGNLEQSCEVVANGLLDPLLKLKGRVGYFTMRGDLPTKYLNHIRGEMNLAAKPSVPIIIMQARDERFARDRWVFRAADQKRYLDEMVEGEAEEAT